MTIAIASLGAAVIGAVAAAVLDRQQPRLAPARVRAARPRRSRQASSDS
jgi:hypothetical protein